MLPILLFAILTVVNGQYPYYGGHYPGAQQLGYGHGYPGQGVSPFSHYYGQPQQQGQVSRTPPQQQLNPYSSQFQQPGPSISTNNYFGGGHPGAGALDGLASYLPQPPPPQQLLPPPPPKPEVKAAPVGCPGKPPKVDYGDCPSLEPKDEDKMKKEMKQKECLKDLEVNENSTLTDLSEAYQSKVTECVLRKDELLNTAGKFNYEKAAEKIKEKALPENVQKKVAEVHVECKIEAERKFLVQTNAVLAEVESYQQCMDFHLAMLCNIKLVTPPNPNLNAFHGVTGLASQSPTNYHHLANVPSMGNGVNDDFGQVMNKISILAQVLRK